MQITNNDYIGTLRQYYKDLIIKKPTKIKNKSYLNTFLAIKDTI